MKQITNLKIKIKRFLKILDYPEFLHKFGPKTYKLEDHISNLFGNKCPTYSALCKRRKKILLKLWQKLLRLTSGLSSGKVAIDGTGFSKSNPSFHYLKRVDKQTPKTYAKLSALLNLETKKFLIMRIRTTPRQDMQDVKYILKRVDKINEFYADKGYDSEELHEFCYWSGIQHTFLQRGMLG